MKLLDRLLTSGIDSLGKARWENWVSWQARLGNVNLLDLYYRQNGILNSENLEVSGEQHLVSSVLTSLLTDSPELTLLDVGGNMGKFSLLLRDGFPNAAIHAFEPVSRAREYFTDNTRGKNIRLHACGMSDRNGPAEITVPLREDLHVMSSLHAEVPESTEGKEGVCTESISLQTLDTFCEEAGIESVDFLKIDTEGHELHVLRGAQSLIEQDRIRAVLFEFNQMNVISRVFLKDFYDILPGFRFFRLDTHRLVDLYAYTPRNELFQFQNIFALHPSLTLSEGFA